MRAPDGDPAPGPSPSGLGLGNEVGSPEIVSRRRSAPAVRISLGPFGQGGSGSGRVMPVVYRHTGGRRRFQRLPALSGMTFPLSLELSTGRPPACSRQRRSASGVRLSGEEAGSQGWAASSGACECGRLCHTEETSGRAEKVPTPVTQLTKVREPSLQFLAGD